MAANRSCCYITIFAFFPSVFVGFHRMLCYRPSCVLCGIFCTRHSNRSCSCYCLRQMGGGAVLTLGFWMHIDHQTTIYIDLLRTVPTSGLLALFEKLPAVFILIGGSVAILSFLGCCGACVDSACFISLVRAFVHLSVCLHKERSALQNALTYNVALLSSAMFSQFLAENSLPGDAYCSVRKISDYITGKYRVRLHLVNDAHENLKKSCLIVQP